MPWIALEGYDRSLSMPLSLPASRNLVPLHLGTTLIFSMLPYKKSKLKHIWMLSLYTSAPFSSAPSPTWSSTQGKGGRIQAPYLLFLSLKRESLQAYEKWHHTSDHNQYLTKEDKDDYYSKCQQTSIEIEAEASRNYITSFGNICKERSLYIWDALDIFSSV